MDSENLINTLSVDLKAHSSDMGEDVNESVESVIDEYILPVVEKVINEYGEDNDLTIDSIDIDLGSLKLKDIPESLESMLRQQIESYLLDKELASFIEEESFVNKGIDIFDSIIDYISSGQIPWEEEQSVFSPVSLVTELVSELLGASVSSTLSEDSRTRLVLFLDSLAEVELMQFVEVLEYSSSNISQNAFVNRDQYNETLNEIISLSIGTLSLKFPSSLAVLQSRKKLWEQYRHVQTQEASSFESIANSEYPEEVNSEDIIDELLFGDSLEEGDSTGIDVHGSVNEDVRIGADTKIEANAVISNVDEIDTPDIIWSAMQGEDVIPSKRMRISDAGLVLLHPFFLHLFKNLSLVRESENPIPGKGKKLEFISPEARIHAAHLLRELTGYSNPHFYHNMILEKIICGLGVDFVMPTQWSISDEERSEIESLLDAVKSYWKPLSKSSNQALQQGFIQREGSVEFSDDSWVVRVEPSAMDILMEDLPWELSFIILPWLDNPVLIDWQRG